MAHTRHLVMGCYYYLSLVSPLSQSWSHSITESIWLEIIKLMLLNTGKYCNIKKVPFKLFKTTF